VGGSVGGSVGCLVGGGAAEWVARLGGWLADCACESRTQNRLLSVAALYHGARSAGGESGWKGGESGMKAGWK